MIPRFSIPFPTWLAGFVAVLIGYAGSAAIIWQAADAAGVEPALFGSWMTALGLAMGVSTLVLTLWNKIPALTAWSTPGAALLATSVDGLSLNEIIGIFMFSAALVIVCGATGLFARLMRIIPQSLAAAMLAGILLRFGLQAFEALPDNLGLGLGMLAGWLVARAIAPRYAIVMTLLVGLVICLVMGTPVMRGSAVEFAYPQFIAPQFNWASLIGVGIPFFLVTMASQNAPGIAVLKGAGYPAPVSRLMVVTGLFTFLLAPFGVFSICIAAISMAVCLSPEAHPDRDKRWQATAAAGIFYIIAGIFGGSITALLTTLPTVYIYLLAGLALLGTIGNSLVNALQHEKERDAALITFLVTASGVSLMGLGAAFWGLIAGGICHVVFHYTKKT